MLIRLLETNYLNNNFQSKTNKLDLPSVESEIAIPLPMVPSPITAVLSTLIGLLFLYVTPFGATHFETDLSLKNAYLSALD